MEILVVSDSSSHWLKLAQILREANYDIHLAENAGEAINIFSEVNLIMIDAGFSHRSIKLCGKLRELGYDTPIIVMGLESLDDVRKSGANDWLELPLFAPEVVLKVKLLLAQYQLWTNRANYMVSETACNTVF